MHDGTNPVCPRTGKDEIVDIYNDNGHQSALRRHIAVGVSMCTLKPEFDEELINPLIPGPGSLLKAVKRLVQSTHPILEAGFHKAWRLLNVHFLSQVAIEECTLDVHLKDGLAELSC